MAKDVTGAVLPGVTVEVSVRHLLKEACITDGRPGIRILDLRPGTYS